MTTVGYGDKYPISAAGRGIAVALMILGIAAFGLITANLAALFLEQQEDETQVRLRAIEEELRQIKAAVTRTNDDANLDV